MSFLDQPAANEQVQQTECRLRKLFLLQEMATPTNHRRRRARHPVLDSIH
jgi:hypothetical protein